MVEATVGNEYAIQLSNALVSYGAEVILVVPKGRKFFLKPDCEVCYWLPPKDSKGRKLLKFIEYPGYLLKILLYALRNRKVIVHFQFFRKDLDSILYFFLHLIGVKTVKTAHNILPHETKRIDYFLNNIVYKYSTAIIVHSDFLKTKLLSAFKVDTDKIRVISHGDHNIYLNQTGMNPKSMREPFGFSEDDRVLLFFGIIREYKGLDLLLEAFDIASDFVPNLKLLVAGNPFTKKLKHFYSEKINKLKHYKNVTAHLEFIPSEKVSNYFSAADIVVLPYKHIDHSGIFHLAYSFGKPIIATRVGDFEEVIEHGKSGFLLESNDAQNLAKWIEIAFTDAKQLKEMGNYAAHLNKTKYSWENVAIKTIEMYRNLNEY